MNTNPDEATLALWLDDELAGPELAAVESWAVSRPEQLAARQEIRRWRSTIAYTLSASEEPPYPDFFNSKVLQAIREQQCPPTPTKKPFFLRSWWMPISACAGMTLAFWVGTKTNSTPEIDVAGAPRAIPVEPVVYTPETGVNAEWVASSKASATVIVLNGLAAIPDATDFSATVMMPQDREIDSTASIHGEPEIGVGP